MKIEKHGDDNNPLVVFLSFSKSYIYTLDCEPFHLKEVIILNFNLNLDYGPHHRPLISFKTVPRP
jgi:hypothetical protein